MGLTNTALFPTLIEVGEAVLFLWERGMLAQHLAISLQRVATGFMIASITAIPVGILLGWVPALRIWVGPTLNFLRQIPPVAWIPLFIMWFGIGEASKSAVIFYAAFFPILLNTQLGVEQIPKSYWEVSLLYRLPFITSLTRLVLPGSAPAVFTGLRLGMGMSWRALVAAEMLAASSGLGYLIMSARSLVRIDEMVVGIFLVGGIGILIDQLFAVLEHRVLPWTQGVSGVSIITGRNAYGKRTSPSQTSI